MRCCVGIRAIVHGGSPVKSDTTVEQGVFASCLNTSAADVVVDTEKQDSCCVCIHMYSAVPMVGLWVSA